MLNIISNNRMRYHYTIKRQVTVVQHVFTDAGNLSAATRKMNRGEYKLENIGYEECPGATSERKLELMVQAPQPKHVIYDMFPDDDDTPFTKSVDDS